MKNHKQEVTFIEYERFTIKELLSIFKEEAQHICKEPDEVHSIAESTLNDFTKRHHKYVRFPTWYRPGRTCRWSGKTKV